MMEHALLLMLVVGAGLLALSGLARVLPSGGLALESGPDLVGARAPVPSGRQACSRRR